MFCFIPDRSCDVIIPTIISFMKAVLNTQQAVNLSWEKYPGLKEMMLCILHLHIFASSQFIVFKLHSVIDRSWSFGVMGW